jgi:NAD(P) transhydrogenase subunit beta
VKREKRPVVEMDELWSFAGSKQNKIWIWLATDRDTRQTAGVAFGDRSDKTCLKLWQSLPPDYRKRAVIYSDFWKSYKNILPSKRLRQVGKESGKTAHVDYDILEEMDVVNPEFKDTDFTLVIGACDVVNPAAIEADGSPISGMPILLTHESKHVVCCNLDDKPGYSGVENPLYENSNTVMLLGDAKETVRKLVENLSESSSAPEESTGQDSPQDNKKSQADSAITALSSAKKIIIIPGYGMALAQAQFKVAELASILESMGAEVKFAIHPVAGRMPGHMNVLLAEAEIDYDNLCEMDEINPEFSQTDAVLVFGACDVVNPAAMDTQGTPISGMPILMAHEAKKIIICNFDEKPGYSGVENTLYDNPKTIMLSGDAASTASDLIDALKS